MIIGVLTMRIHMSGIGSLKAKRSIVKSLIERLKSRFNVSVAEVGEHDNKSGAVIGMAVVANESRFVNSVLEKIIRFCREDGRFYVGQIDREVFSS